MAPPDFISDEEMAALEAQGVATHPEASGLSFDGPLPDFISDSDMRAIESGEKPSFALLGQDNPTVLQQSGRMAAGGFLNLLNSLTFGLGDEGVAGVNAAIDWAEGDAGFGEAYDQRLNEARGYRQAFRNEHPIVSFAEDIGGALAMPIGTTLKAGDGLLTAGAKLAGEGAGYGAAYGFGEGEGGFDKRAESALDSAKFGAVAAPSVGLPLFAVGKGLQGLAKNAPENAQALYERGLGAKPSDYTKSARQGGVYGKNPETHLKQSFRILTDEGILQGPKDPKSLYQRHEAQSQSLAGELWQYLRAADAKKGNRKVFPKFLQADDYIAQAAVDDRPMLRRRLQEFKDGLSNESDGSVQFLQNQKEAVYSKAYPEGHKAIEDLDKAIGRDLRTAIEHVTDQALPPQDAGIVRQLNKRLSAYEETRSIFARELGKAEAETLFDKALDLIKTTGGAGTPAIVGSVLGGPMGALLGGGAGLGLKYLQTAPGHIYRGDAIQTLGRLFNRAPVAFDSLPRLSGLAGSNRPSAQDHGKEGPTGAPEQSSQERTTKRSYNNSTTANEPIQRTSLSNTDAAITPELLDRLRKVESGGNNKAVSPKGAQGPYQFMPATAKDLGLDDPTDPIASRAAAETYLTRLVKMFGTPQLALAAYNYGPGNVRKAQEQSLKKGDGTDFEDIYDLLPKETRNYVSKFSDLLEV